MLTSRLTRWVETCLSGPNRALLDFWTVRSVLLATQTGLGYPFVAEMVPDPHPGIVSGLRRNGQFQSNRHPTADRFVVTAVLTSCWVAVHQLVLATFIALRSIGQQYHALRHSPCPGELHLKFAFLHCFNRTAAFCSPSATACRKTATVPRLPQSARAREIQMGDTTTGTRASLQQAICCWNEDSIRQLKTSRCRTRTSGRSAFMAATSWPR